MDFSNWSKVHAYNETAEIPLYCKAHLSKIGLKPKDETIYEKHDVYVDRHWKTFKFYTLDNTIAKRPHVRTSNDLPETPDNICEALYLINKSAKKSRDTAQSSYYHSNHTQAKIAKTRKNNLYDLKDKTIKKLVEDGILELVGYHTQTIYRATTYYYSTCYDKECYYHSQEEDGEFECYDDECEYCESKQYTETEVTEEKTTYLLLYQYQNFTFHTPHNGYGKPKHLNYLGDIQDLISQEATQKCNIKYTDAVNLLKKYCGEVAEPKAQPQPEAV
jgi:hypothetical protein